MTTPPQPPSQPEPGDEDSAQEPNTSNGKDNVYRPYPSTPHPEDSPGYGNYGVQYPSYPNAGYPSGDQYGAGYAGAPSSSWVSGEEVPMVQGTGIIDPLKAFKWGVKKTFQNWSVWVLFTLLLFFVLVIFGVLVSLWTLNASGVAEFPYTSTFDPTLSIVSFVFGLLISVLYYNGALRQVDRAAVGWGDLFKNINFWQLLGATFLVALVQGLIQAALIGLFSTGSPVWASVVGLSVALVVGTLISPFFVLIPWYVADRQASVIGAFRVGVSAGARNYGRLILFQIVFGVASVFLIIITLGIAGLFVMPIQQLTYAHIYRQAAGLNHPA